MNPGAAEEAGKVATGFFDAMKSNPLALALAATNLLMIGLLFYISKQASDTREHEFAAIMENNKGISQLLYNCMPVTKP